MTSQDPGIALRILGPLEARLCGEAIALGSAKQRTVLATLLLRAGEIVTIGHLVDELWGQSPPPSAAHTLEVYMSRLRQLLNGHGPALVRRGAGYVLELGAASLDATAFVDGVKEVSQAAREGEHERVATKGRNVLGLWRGAVLADVELGPLGRADAQGLEELRLRTCELYLDAELALGRHESAVGELHALVGQNPYRERFVSQLMLALYRSGRHAEALDAYEQTRRRLDDDLGLQPSVDLQQLSAEIVRQEPKLRVPAAARVGQPPSSRVRERTGRLSIVVGIGAATVAAMALAAGGGAADLAASANTSAVRLALVLQRGSPVSALPAWRSRDLVDGLYDLSAQQGYEAELMELADDVSAADVAQTSRRLADGRFDLVLLALNAPSALAFAPVTYELPETRFVFIDASVGDLELAGERNVTAIRFATEQPGQLAGALSGLLSPRGGELGRRPDRVSVVAGNPTPETRRIVAAFRRGFTRALPTGTLEIGYTNETVDPTACELEANGQIDAGSDVVFVHAGACGEGALAVARARGVWAIGSDGVGRVRDNVIGGMFKDWDNALLSAVQAYSKQALPAGRDVVLGLDGYNVGLEMHPSLSPAIASKVVELCSSIRVGSTGVIPTHSEP